MREVKEEVKQEVKLKESRTKSKQEDKEETASIIGKKEKASSAPVIPPGTLPPSAIPLAKKAPVETEPDDTEEETGETVDSGIEDSEEEEEEEDEIEVDDHDSGLEEEGDEVDEATEESGSEEVGEIDADSDADDGDEASKPDDGSAKESDEESSEGEDGDNASDEGIAEDEKSEDDARSDEDTGFESAEATVEDEEESEEASEEGSVEVSEEDNGSEGASPEQEGSAEEVSRDESVSAEADEGSEADEESEEEDEKDSDKESGDEDRGDSKEEEESASADGSDESTEDQEEEMSEDIASEEEESETPDDDDEEVESEEAMTEDESDEESEKAEESEETSDVDEDEKETEEGASTEENEEEDDQLSDEIVEEEEEEEEDDEEEEEEETEEEKSIEAGKKESRDKKKRESPPIVKLSLNGVRKRGHIAEALGFALIGSDADREEEKLIAQILKDIKKIATDSIKPLEKSFRFSDISQRVLGDAEIFNKPMVLFLGPWSSGKSTAINYLLGTDNTRAALKTGPQPTDSFFTVVHYNEDGIVRESGLKMAGDWAFSGVNKFGQAFLSHFRGIGLNHPLLQKVTIVDTLGVIDGRRFKDFSLEDVFQWFIDRADAIYVVFDPSKLEIGSDMKSMLDQLRGREQQTRFLLNKADLIEASEVTRVTGQLLWNVSPLLGSSDAPIIYTVSMINRPYLPGSPAEYLKDQEEELLNHLKEVMDERVENTIMFARRHAVRVRNHAKLVDCYLDAFYKHKGMFGNKKKVAEQIIKDPAKYRIFGTISQSTNISRYDLLEPEDYAAFFKLNPLQDFPRLKELCGYLKGCPIDKLDRVIAYELPQLLTKYLEKSSISHGVQERGTDTTKATLKVPTKSRKSRSK
ncbi:sarcalumenin-like isoform X2 [Varroa destructor]|uniref:Dynamin-type G domain-containing protein n=1 Tax=Varroa destructor TaxID=109461 RepID=A0A7M7K5B6_VARDE|nr:sarcalumenin-like isoform X2 [Varroa destructor]